MRMGMKCEEQRAKRAHECDPSMQVRVRSHPVKSRADYHSPPCSRSMAVASLVGVGAPALAGTSGTAIISRDFSQRKPSSCAVLESQLQCSLRCIGESISSSSKYAWRWGLSKAGAKAVHCTSTRTKTRIRALEGIEMEDVEVDYNVQRRRPLRPVVERFNIHHEKNVSEERLKELGVSRWSKWECGPGVTTFWKWKVDELVYISKGSVEVVPEGCQDEAIFYAGDLVRFPKWFEASLTFDEDYEQYYKFFAYGD